MPWRVYTPADKPETDALHARMEARLGRDLDLPQLDERPVLISLVYEDKGVITHAVFLEAEAEVCAMGECSLPRSEWESAAQILQQVLDSYRIRIVRAFVVPEALERKNPKKPTALERILKHFGLQREDVNKLVPFSKWLG